jgi:predicted RNA-binding Zn-ribbon protein involved in translation (DUF1610 family)
MMAEGLVCPNCGYALTGIGDPGRVRCPECGHVYRWSTLRQWAAEGRYVPPLWTLWFTLATPLVEIVAGLCARAVLLDGPLRIGVVAGWIWATAWLAVMFIHALRRHGGAFGAALAMFIAPLLGAVWAGCWSGIALGAISL